MWIDPNHKDPREIYKLMIGFIGPRPIGWISSISKQGQHNLAPYSFFNMWSMNPAVIGFAAGLSRDGKKKDSLINVEETSCFVHNVVTEDLVEPMNATSEAWDHGVSEFEKVGLTACPSEKVAAPRVQEAKINVECELIQVVSLGQEPGNGQLCLGKVVGIHINDESVLAEDAQVNEDRLALVSRLGRTNYMNMGRIYSIDRPPA